MPEYDGDIKLSVSLDPKSVVKSADELTRKITDIFEASNGKQTDAGFKKLLSAMDKTVTKADAVRDRLLELENVENRTDAQNVAYSKLSSQLGGLNNEMRTLVDQAAKTMADLNGELTPEEMEDVDVVTRYAQALEEVDKSANSLKTRMAELGKTLLKSFGSTMLSPVTAFAERLKSVGKNATGVDLNLSKMFKNLFRYGLGIRSIFFLFNKLRNAVREGFTNLMQFNGGTNSVASTVNNLKASLATLKNSWAAAFAPILQYVAPVLQTLISWLISAANAIGSFFAALTGKSKMIKATAVNTKALGKSIGGAGKAAKKAKGELAAFDELNIIGSKDSGGGGGGGGAGGGLGNFFKEEDIESKFKDLADLVKKSWENADFTELGTMVGEQIKKGLDISYGYLTNQVKDFAWRLSRSLATFLNGVIEVEGLGISLGKNIGAALNDAFLFVNTFLENFHFVSFGKFIGEALISAIREFDWGNVSSFLINRMIAVFDTLTGVVQSIDWRKLPSDVWTMISEFVRGINFKAFFTSIAKLIGSVLGGIAALGQVIWEWISTSIDNIATWIDEKTKETGGNIVQGILDGIDALFTSIGNWVNEHIFKPFMDAFHAVFDMHSPSKVMEEQGRLLIQGLFNGITSLITSVVNIFINLKNKIVEIWSNVKSKTSEIWTNIKTAVSNTVSSLSSKVADIWNGLKTKIGDIISTIKTNAVNLFESMKTSVSNVVTGLKNKVIDIFSGMWGGIRGFINNIIGGVERMANGVVSGVNAVIRSMNKLSFKIPDWVPQFGGDKFGFNLKEVGKISIPRLAQGAVIPPNNEFLAVLGDQRRGTNIEAPLDTIKDAVRSVLSEGSESTEEMVLLLQQLVDIVESKELTISEREIGNTAIKIINREKRRTGTSPILE